MIDHAASAATGSRDVFVGSHSKVWKGLSARLGPGPKWAIGHRDIAGFDFTLQDRVWVLSYSRLPEENAALLAALRDAGVGEVVYVSSSSVIVGSLTDCYEYPRVKQQAERDALALPNARVLTIGLMYERAEELPAGLVIATSYDELAAFIATPGWPDEAGRRKRLFRLVQRPFGGAAERWAHAAYGRLLRWSGGYPCLLRPIDLVLRACGMRWYGYVHLSNSLWISTIS